MPLLQNDGIWKKAGRWDSIGRELFRLKDRKGKGFCVGPTHEEAFAKYASIDLQSFKQLPIKLYQVDRKFRDELRPSGGLYRSREFWMKDLYCLDADYANSEMTYQHVTKAYTKIAERLGLVHMQDFMYVKAESGTMGGDYSQELVVFSQRGKDDVVHCLACSAAEFLEPGPEPEPEPEEQNQKGLDKDKDIKMHCKQCNSAQVSI